MKILLSDSLIIKERNLNEPVNLYMEILNIGETMDWSFSLFPYSAVGQSAKLNASKDKIRGKTVLILFLIAFLLMNPGFQLCLMII